MKPCILVVDNDAAFLDRMRVIIDELGLLSEFDYSQISIRGESGSAGVEQCRSEVADLIASGVSFRVAFVDVVFVESDTEPIDRSGLDAAIALRGLLPDVPIVGITRFHKNHRLLLEASFSPVLTGILVKPFIESGRFTRRDFFSVLERAQVLLATRTAAEPSNHLDARPEQRRAKLEREARKSVFIGTSVEGIPIGEAIQLNLDRHCEPTLWSQGVFGLSRTTIEELVSTARRVTFAILVLTPDDVLTKRDVTSPAPRDNLLFELGLFMGTIGRENTYMVVPRYNKIAVPSDLLGIMQAEYDDLRSDGNLQAALAPVCIRLLKAMGIS